MTHLLKQAIERLRVLPEPRQDEFAHLVLEELEADDRWTESTASHVDGLRRLADDVLADDARGV